MNRRRVALALMAASLAAGMLGGCGQKGPLFLPDQALEEIKREKDERERDRQPAPTPPAQTQGMRPAPAAVHG